MHIDTRLHPSPAARTALPRSGAQGQVTEALLHMKVVPSTPATDQPPPPGGLCLSFVLYSHSLSEVQESRGRSAARSYSGGVARAEDGLWREQSLETTARAINSLGSEIFATIYIQYS